MMSLAEFPQDVLMELAKQLDIQDLFNFLATCCVICELQHEQTLWVDALTRIKEVDLQPLPLSTAKSLETLSARELQNVARQALRLRKNLQSDKPRHVRMHRFSVRTSPRIKNIFFIPGTHLVVTSTYGSLDCWDILTAERMGHLKVPGLWVRTESALCMDGTGRTLLAGCIQPLGANSVQNLVAICIDSRDRTLSYLRSPTSSTYFPKSGVFIDSRIIGFVADSAIVFWRMDVSAGIETTPQDVVDMYGARCLPWGRSIYVLTMEETSDGVVQFLPHPISNLQATATDTSPTSVSATFSAQYPSDVSNPVYLAPQIVVPHYGIFAVTCRSFTYDSRLEGFALIHFRAAYAKSIQEDLEFRQGMIYKHHHYIHAMALGLSGTYVLILARDLNRKKGYLGLVHFSATPVPSTTFRKLDVDGALVASCAKIALDDALGLVLLLDWEGKMTIFSYL
ncbi:hypothetical protein C8R45DRAFT_91801 [Mycena sanguinolenta]|nr:hypothetical protein C8R45DRAFT_91801 [Mycena sanguinolenta]